MKTVSLINPWSKQNVEKPIEAIIPYLQSIPWPEEVTFALSGMVDTDEEFVEKAVAMMGPEQAGMVIIGS